MTHWSFKTSASQLQFYVSSTDGDRETKSTDCKSNINLIGNFTVSFLIYIHSFNIFPSAKQDTKLTFRKYI